MEPKRKPVWFVPARPGRFTVVDWRGWVVALCLGAVLVAGSAVEDALKRAHPVLAPVALVALAAVAFALVALLISRTERR